MIAFLSSLVRLSRKRQLTKHLSTNLSLRITKLLLLLSLLVLINSGVMIWVEKMAVGDAFWLSFTTLTTVGYGDFSASTTVGRITTVVTMYGFAITMLSLLAAEVIEWRLQKTERKRKGLWEFKDMVDHIQIINTPNRDTERYLIRLISEIQKTPQLQELPIQLLTRKFGDGLPESLSSLKVLHRHGAAEDGVMLKHINLEHAKHVIILARDAAESLSDSISFDILSQVVAVNPDANILVEAVLDENRERFLKLGANAVIRPIRAYPEMVARTLSHPGTEGVLEDLFRASGESIHRFDVPFRELRWMDIVSVCIRHQIGTPIGYFFRGDTVVQPKFERLCEGDGLAVLINHKTDVDTAAVARALKEAALKEATEL